MGVEAGKMDQAGRVIPRKSHFWLSARTKSFAFGQQTRKFSALSDALSKEIEEIDSAQELLVTSEIVNSILSEDSPFQLSSKNTDDKVELKNGNVRVSFQPEELERGSEDEIGIRFTATMKEGDSQITFQCIAKKEGDSEGVVELEECFVEPASATEDSEEPYCPPMGDLDDVLVEELHNYLGDVGVDSYLAADICDIAEGVENAYYYKWLESLKSFVDKQNK